MKEGVANFLYYIQRISKKPKQYDDTTELDHSQEVIIMPFPPGVNPPKMLKPGEEALDFPASPVTPKWSTILGFGLLPVDLMRRNHFDAKGGHFRVQGIAVVCLVANDPLRKLNQKPTFQGLVNQLHFMRRSTVHVEGVRKTMAVRHSHDFCPLPPFRFPNTKAPLFAGEKVPSIKASRMSSPPRSLRSWAKTRSISSNTPSFDHFWCQRWQVWYGGYRSGRSFQGAPVRSIHRMPSSTSRGWRRGRPRGSDRLDTGGIKGSNSVHCSSVKSIQHILGIHYKSTSFF